MNIVVLDGYTLNPGDLSWNTLRSLGPCTIHDRTQPAETIARAADAEIVLTNKTILSHDVIERLPKLRYVGVLATGYNVVDLAAARAKNILVTNVPDYATASVVQMVFAHLMNLTLRVADHGRGVAAGRWTRSPDFAYWDFPLVELSGQTLGVVGFGRIGRRVAEVARALDMNVIACTRRPPVEPPSDIAFVELDELFRRSDVVSLHCPLTPETQRMVDRRRLTFMKPTAYLINTGRGPLVDEAALAEALNAGHLAGAGLDVLSTEPPEAGNPLLTAKNCCITPHIGWATLAARRRLMTVVVDNVRAFLAGTPQNVVN
ncbi:MAG: D-2-hydroxyacid dehydrogenase [Planctomycetaceae bacterium]|nr:D-2-hydroxyacid dehydrogenase [Planctomycetaceae bacterium]